MLAALIAIIGLGFPAMANETRYAVGLDERDAQQVTIEVRFTDVRGEKLAAHYLNWQR